MSAIFAYLIRKNEKSNLVYVTNNGWIGCFSTLFMIEINMLRYKEEEKMNNIEKKVFNKKVKKYKERVKLFTKEGYKKDLSHENPEIRSFPL
jgi:hypothetical protein